MPDWLVILSLLATAGVSVYGARYAGRSSVKVKEMDVAGKAYEQANGITTGLIKSLQDQQTKLAEQRESDRAEYKASLKERDERYHASLKERDERLDRVETDLRELKEHNYALTRYCYRLIDLLRTVGHGDKIPTPPPHGIHL